MNKIGPRNSSRLAIPLVVFGLVLGLVAVLISIHQHKIEPAPPPGALTSKSAPSSVKPKPQVLATYTVPPTDPKYIAIPVIGISNTPILKLGLTRGGAIAVPDNIYETGWYDGSSRPGQQGAMFIYGHVSSWTADGIFYNLKRLVPGDKITVTRGDNKTYTYQVVSLKTYAYNDVPMATVLSPVESGTPALNLMSCTGQVIAGTSEFSERLVVYTNLLAN